MTTKPKNGSRFTITGVVTDDAWSDHIFSGTPDLQPGTEVRYYTKDATFTDPPWEPKVGDKVKFVDGTIVYTLLALHNGKAWLAWEDKHGQKCDATVTFKTENYILCAD